MPPRPSPESRLTTLARARRLALSQPESTERDHHGFPSFRVGGRIFATVPDPAHLHVMLPPDHVAMAVGAAPQACEELWWGKRLAGVRVTISAVPEDLLATLLTEAWRLRSPSRLTGGAVSGRRVRR